MGYSFSKGMRICQTTKTALDMALKNKKRKGKTILHSDRGFQYNNPGFVEENEKYNSIPSMTENSDPYENTVTEKEIDKAIKPYNNYRPHWSLDLKTPNYIYSNSNAINENAVS